MFEEEQQSSPYLWISELRRVEVDDGVVGVHFEAVPPVSRVRNVLRLVSPGQGEDGHDAIVLVREETAGVVCVYNRGAAKNVARGVCLAVQGREQGDWLVLPGVAVCGGRVAPVLVASYYGIGIIWGCLSIRTSLHDGSYKAHIGSRDGICQWYGHKTCH